MPRISNFQCLLLFLLLSGFPIISNFSLITSVAPLGSLALDIEFMDRENDQLWNQFFEANGSRRPFAVIESYLGGFILTGQIVHYDVGLEDIWLARTDSNGNLEWERSFPGDKREWGQAIIECTSGELVLTGTITDSESEIFVMKTDSVGNMLWQRIFNFTRIQEAQDIVELPSGELVVCGYVRHYRPTNPVDGLIFSVNETGSLLWKREYGGQEEDYFNSLSITKDGSLILGGISNSYGNAAESMWLVKTNSLGVFEWNQTYGNFGYDKCNGISINNLGEFTLAGISEDSHTLRMNALIVHTTNNGTIVWNRTIDSDLDIAARDIVTCSDGGYALTGQISESSNTPWFDMIVIRIGNNGDTLWQKIYGGMGNDRASSLVETREGHLVIAGSTSSFGYEGGTAWLTLIPDAPPALINPSQINRPLALFGVILALLIIMIAASFFYRSHNEIKSRIRTCV